MKRVPRPDMVLTTMPVQLTPALIAALNTLVRVNVTLGTYDRFLEKGCEEPSSSSYSIADPLQLKRCDELARALSGTKHDNPCRGWHECVRNDGDAQVVDETGCGRDIH